MKLIVSSPINNLSFGNVSYNFLREIWRKKHELSLFPIGDVDISAFDKSQKPFLKYLQESTDARLNSFDKKDFCLKFWHIIGAETRISERQALFTFHETSELTLTEKNVLANQNIVFVSSSYSQEIIKNAGIENVHFVPLGFDEDFFKTGKEYMPDKIHFGLMGKFEHRKNTARIIKAWLKIFGNDPKYQLTCSVSNPFRQNIQLQTEISRIFQGKHYGNINFIPRVKTNSEVNDYLNSIDIDLGGLSGAEGWNLPSFNAACLGKWSVVLNATAHKDWATEKNSILINPSSLKDCYDGVFFHKGSNQNQGHFFDISDAEMEAAIESSVKFAKTPNPEGESLRQKFTYSKSYEKICQVLNGAS